MALPVVSTHSAISDRHEHDALAPFLGGREHVTWDMPGWGRTEEPTAPWSPSGSLLALLDERGLERCVLMGSSYGGLVSVELALHAPERVAGLVLLAPALDIGGPDPEMDAFDDEEERLVDADDMEGFAALNIAFWAAGPRRSPDVVAPEVRSYLEGTLARVAELQGDVDVPQEGLVDGVAARLGTLRIPTLVVVGDEDAVRLQQCAEAYADSLPMATLVELRRVAHLPALEAPERLGPHVERFLAELP